jgi:hypothetical protein
MFGELFASAKSGGADIHAISRLTDRIGALDTFGMRQVALIAIALNLRARLIYSMKYTIPLGWVEGTTYFGFHPAGVVVFYERRSSQKKGTDKPKVAELEKRWSFELTI